MVRTYRSTRFAIQKTVTDHHNLNQPQQNVRFVDQNKNYRTLSSALEAAKFVASTADPAAKREQAPM